MKKLRTPILMSLAKTIVVEAAAATTATAFWATSTTFKCI